MTTRKQQMAAHVAKMDEAESNKQTQKLSRTLAIIDGAKYQHIDTECITCGLNSEKLRADKAALQTWLALSWLAFLAVLGLIGIAVNSK